MSAGPVGSRLASLAADPRVFARGLGLVVHAAPRAAIFHLFLVAALNLLPVAQVWLSKLVVDRLAGAPLDAAAVRGALVLAALYAATFVAAAALQPVLRALSGVVEERSLAAVDRRLMDAGARLADLDRIERPSLQDELRMLREWSYYAPRLFATLEQGPGTFLTFAGLAALLAGLHPLIPVALGVTLLAHLAAQRRLSVMHWDLRLEQSRAVREMDYSARVASGVAAAKEVRVFGLGPFFHRRYRAHADAALAELSRMHVRNLAASAAFAVLYAAVLGGGFAYVAAGAGAGRLTLGDVALYLNAVLQAQTHVTTAAWWFGFVHEGLLHLRRFFAFVEGAGPTIAVADPPDALPAPPAPREGITLRGVRFRYPEGDRDVLVDVTARIRAGRITAVVGPNGAGKTTLVKLLTRMYDPTAGAILLDGAPLATYDLESLRRRVAVVHQDFARFALSLRDNVAVGAGPAGPPDGRVEQAATWAGADALAARLPQGYETQLTRLFDGGVELSGGEWQAVAVARAFARDAAVVILDEPTAALDAEAEHRLFERFRELLAGKTGVVISHRFSTVRMADHILVLDSGRVIEAGAHHELVAQGGRYAGLFEMQAGRYR